MSMNSALHVLWRHKWLMLAIIFVTMLAIPLRILTARGEYTASVKVLVTAPEKTHVDLFGSFRTMSEEEEINIARNNFVDVLRSDETRRRVIVALALPEALHDYRLHVSVSRETNFLTVNVTTFDGQWAAQIANEHVAQARQYFGEIRAQPAALAKLALAAQISEASTQLNQAEQALVDFKNQHLITSISAEHTLRMNVLSRLYDQRYQAQLASSGAILTQAFPELIRSLDAQRSAAINRNELDRAAAWDQVIAFTSAQILEFTSSDPTVSPIDRLSQLITDLEAQRLAAEQAGQRAVAESYAYAVAYYSGQLLALKQAASSLAVTNQLIAEQEAKIMAVNELAPRFNELESRAEQAKSNYLTLSSAYQEATIKEDTALRSDFIQVVLPAAASNRPNQSSAISLIVLGLVGSLGAAIALAFVAEFLGRWLWPSDAAAAQPKALERRHG
jgi:polysaccharide biosynthesis transport protein